MTTKPNKDIIPSWLMGGWMPQLLIAILALLLYGNTIGHEFSQDDAIVIYDNAYTQKGLSGIPDLFAKDTFSGFFKEEGKDSLVSGGRYRPMTPAVFAVIWEFVGNTPWGYHLFSILSFALLSLTLYWVLLQFSRPFFKDYRKFALVGTMLFVVHPIHTEVVANVKGLDEIWSLQWSMLSLLCGLFYQRSGSFLSLIGSLIAIFIALLSKENAVVWVVLIPFTLYFFGPNEQRKRLFFLSGSIVLSLIIYLILRGQIVGLSLGELPNEMMNNPFIKVVDGNYLPFTSSEKWASITYGLGKYIQLLFVPHPLTHDYYPRQFGVMSWADPEVLMAALMHLMIVGIAVLGIWKRSFTSYCVIFFYATIALTSNIIFPIGTHLSERFLFTPSIAYGLLGAYAWIRLSRKWEQLPTMLLAILCILYSGKTITRNNAWQSDFRLFTTDVYTSKHSAKVRNAAGGALIQKSITIDDPSEKKKLLTEAKEHLAEAIRIHPRYKNAHLLLGNAFTYLLEYPDAIVSYDNALRLDPYYADAESNLKLALIEGAREAGSKNQDYNRAISFLERALKIVPKDYQVNSLLGIAHGSRGDHQIAINYFVKSIEINSSVARAYVNLGYAQLNMGLEDDARINFHRAVEIDPNALDRKN
jgi:tetratricopeptide (TPR) repeat protein